MVSLALAHLILAGAPARFQGTLVPDAPDDKPIEGGLSAPGSAQVVEGSLLDELVYGSDSDRWHYQANTLSKVIKGNSNAVGIAAFKLKGDRNSGQLLGTPTTSSQSETTLTLLFVRSVDVYNWPANEYPVACVDRYRIFDAQDPSVVPDGVQYDGNVVTVAKQVFVSKKTN